MRIVRSSLLIIASSLFSLPLAAPEPGYTVYGVAPRYEMMTTKFIPKNEPIVAAPIEPVVEEPKGRWVWAKVTAYSPHVRSCGKWSKLGLTSTGVQVRSPDPDDAYGIAANPKVIPYGSFIYVEEYHSMLQNNNKFIPTTVESVDDTGGGMRQFTPYWKIVNGNRVFITCHIDVRFRNQSTAQKWGVKYLQIFIYE